MYLWMKLLHVLFVIMFLGNISTGLFWHWHAARTGDPRLLAHTVDGIIRSDRWLTMPGVVGIIATGVAAAMLGGFPILRTGWIWWTLVLFAGSGLAFMWQVAPLQRKMLAAAQAVPFDRAVYGSLARRWEWWGALALALPLGGLVLMVAKPAL